MNVHVIGDRNLTPFMLTTHICSNRAEIIMKGWYETGAIKTYKRCLNNHVIIATLRVSLIAIHSFCGKRLNPLCFFYSHTKNVYLFCTCSNCLLLAKVSIAICPKCTALLTKIQHCILAHHISALSSESRTHIFL